MEALNFSLRGLMLILHYCCGIADIFNIFLYFQKENLLMEQRKPIKIKNSKRPERLQKSA